MFPVRRTCGEVDLVFGQRSFKEEYVSIIFVHTPHHRDQFPPPPQHLNFYIHNINNKKYKNFLTKKALLTTLWTQAAARLFLLIIYLRQPPFAQNWVG